MYIKVEEQVKRMLHLIPALIQHGYAFESCPVNDKYRLDIGFGRIKFNKTRNFIFYPFPEWKKKGVPIIKEDFRQDFIYEISKEVNKTR